MGVLNLTIDKAPTNPNDNAKEDFTIKIIKNVIKDNIGRTLEIWDLLDKDTDFSKYKYFKEIDKIAQHIKLKKVLT